MRRGSNSVSALAALLAATWAVALAIGGCSGKKTSGDRAAAAAVDKSTIDVAPAEPEKPAPAPAPAPAADSRKTMLRLTLRSTPPGATAAVDGREVGKTPMVYELEA